MEKYYVEHITAEMKAQGMEFFLQKSQHGILHTPAHIHEAIEILAVHSGQIQVYINETEYCAKKGDILLLRSNAIHKIYSERIEESAYYVLKVNPSLFLELASEQNATGYILRFVLQDKESKSYWAAEDPDGQELRNVFENLFQELASDNLCRDMALKLCAGQVLLCMLRDILREEIRRGIPQHANNTAATQIYKAIRYINENYGNDINAETCGEFVHMSYSYFSRGFKNVTGISFKSYLNQVRINHAEKLLTTTGRSVTQIALDCGYNNVAYFINVYKQIKGKTPLAERKLLG